LRDDGKYKNRHIFKFNDMFSDMVRDGYAESFNSLYNDIKGTETHLRLKDPNISQEKLAAKTFKIFKEEFEGATPTPTPRNSNSSGTRGRRRRSNSNSSGTRGRRRSNSNSSGTRGRRRRSSNSSGTRGRRRSNSSGIRRISSDRSLHSSDL
jgi:hypothetical protein